MTNRHWNVNKDQSVRQVMIANQDRTFAAIIAFVRKGQTAGIMGSCLMLFTLLTGPVQAQDVVPNSDSGSKKTPGAATDPPEGGVTRPTVNKPAPKPTNTQPTSKPSADAPANAAAELLALEVELEKRREAAMQIRKPLLEPGAIEKYNRVRFLSMMRSGTGNGSADKKIFNESLRYRVLELAEEGNFKKAGDLRISLLRSLKSCGSKIPSPLAKKKFRQETMAKVVAHAETMLDNQLTVRISAVHLIGHLDLESGSTQKPPVPYLGAFESLLKVVNDKDQLPSVKLAAVRGLQRILRLGGVANAVQDTIGGDLMNVALKGNPAFPWLDELICHTMAEVKTTKDNRLQGMLKIMADPAREWRVRSAAAFAIGRTGWNPKDADRLAYRVTELMHQISVAYNKNPRNTNLISYTYRCYLAYHHDTGEDKNAKIGFLKRAATAKVQQSFEKLVVPTVNTMINRAGKRLPSKLLEAQSKWLKDNAAVIAAAQANTSPSR